MNKTLSALLLGSVLGALTVPAFAAPEADAPVRPDPTVPAPPEQPAPPATLPGEDDTFTPAPPAVPGNERPQERPERDDDSWREGDPREYPGNGGDAGSDNGAGSGTGSQ